MGGLAFALRVTVIRPNPFVGYQSQRGRGLSRDTPLLYILSVFLGTMSDNVAKRMKVVERKQPSRRRHLSLARADIVRHTSGIVIAWFDNVRLRLDLLDLRAMLLGFERWQSANKGLSRGSVIDHLGSIGGVEASRMEVVFY